MKANHYLSLALVFLWGFWGLYVLIMGLYRAQLDKRLNGPMSFLGAPYLVVGYLVDVACNLTLATLVLLELPRELLVTTRLTRHLRSGDGWRHALATWVCNKLLDPLDPRGKHCQ